MTNDWKDRFKKGWAEEAHEQLDACGFEKDNQDDVSKPSTTKRSEALAFQALMFTFAYQFLEKELSGAPLTGRPIKDWLNEQVRAGVVKTWQLVEVDNDRKVLIEFV